MATYLSVSAYQEINELIEDAIDGDRGYLLVRDGDTDVLHLHTHGAEGCQLVIGRAGKVHYHPMDPRLSPKVAYRIWRATRVAR